MSSFFLEISEKLNHITKTWTRNNENYSLSYDEMFT